MRIHYVPARKVSISEIHDDLWDMAVSVNRASWRKLSFGAQHSIGRKVSDLQAELHELLLQAYGELNHELSAIEQHKNYEQISTETEASTETSTETEASPETSTETSINRRGGKSS